MKSFLASIIFVAAMLISPREILAQAEPAGAKEELSKAEVIEILDEGTKHLEIAGDDFENDFQKVKLRILDGEDAGDEVIFDHGGQYGLTKDQKVQVSQVVIVTKMFTPDGFEYQIIDRYRLNELLYIALIFLVMVLALSRWKGVGSFLGMLLSLGIIIKFIIPQILAGHDPLLISILGSIFILVSTIYLAHGFSKQTTIAVVSTAITLVLTGFLAVTFVNMTHLTGLSSEDAVALQYGPTALINFKGLLLGGMIIGFLGVLDDVTTGMAATVFELKKVNPKLKAAQLISSSLNVGREHISSLVNTLVLAYAGASLPLFLFIVLNPNGYPMWFVLNSEFVSEEIVRTLVGSIGLLMAVPITTLLATWAVERKQA